MDIQIRYWDNNDALVKTRYYDSQFIYGPNGENLLESILNSLDGLPLEKMNHLSMEGPSVNWKVFESLNTIRDEKELPSLQNIGSCGLHVVNGAFQTGFQSGASWDLHKIFKAMWQFFHDSPARRDHYIRINAATEFPLSFCSTRWVEGESVAVRAISTWGNVIQVVKYFLSLAPSKRPKNNKSFDTLTKYHSESLISQISIF